MLVGSAEGAEGAGVGRLFKEASTLGGGLPGGVVDSSKRVNLWLDRILQRQAVMPSLEKREKEA